MWKVRVTTEHGTFHPEHALTFNYGLEEFCISLVHPTESEKVLLKGWMQAPTRENWNEWLEQARQFRDQLNGVK